MNKYLLLRDNKQSGPYTVPELIAKGIKPYDLVWLDGKSAAWRYPSEIEELKAYSPVVEEQPFDRFYKKPEFSLDVKPEAVDAADSSVTRFQPKVTEPEKIFEPVPVPKPVPAIDHTAVKKVYINFPGIKKEERPEQQVKPAPAIKEERTYANAYEKTFSLNQPEEPISENHFNTITPSSNRKTKSEKNIFLAVVAACFVLVMAIGVLIVNYMNQRSNLDHLNLLVQQMEQRQKERDQLVPAVVRTEQSAPTVIAPAAEVNATNPAPADYNVQENAPAKKEKKPVPLKPEDPSVKFIANRAPSNSGANESSQATSAAKPSPTVESYDISNENIFKLVSVKANKYKTGLLGGISNLQLELTNNSKKELHKVAVEINFLGPEKKVVKTQTIYFENVSPGMQSTIDVPRSNRGVTVTYTVTDIKS